MNINDILKYQQKLIWLKNLDFYRWERSRCDFQYYLYVRSSWKAEVNFTQVKFKG